MPKLKFNLYGIKKRLLIFVLPLVLVPLIVANLVTYFALNNYIQSIIIDQLEQSNLSIFDTYKSYMDEIDENTKRIIYNKSVQSNLHMSEITLENKISIERYLSLFIYNNIDSIYYIDNKQNIMHTTIQYNSNLQDILDNEATKQLEGTYGEMKIAIDHDNEQQYVFISRYVRHLDLNINPGILILKVNLNMFKEIFREDLLVENSDYLIVDNNGMIAYHNDTSLIGTQYRHSEFNNDKNKYILTKYTEDKTNWSIISYVSHKDVFSSYRKYQFLMYAIMLSTAILAVVLVMYLSKRFTSPIEDLTHAMLDFDNGYFNTRLSPKEHDEIGDAAYSFNHMADNITQLIKDNELKQQELRKSELRTLVHQINPHLIYNTLDNINMLLRMKGDKNTSNLIMSLSRFLRISLSKGHMFISLNDEFEHGRYYLEIQTIRYSNLFTYSIDLQEEIKDYKVNKFIIQPFLENCIKHGFADRYEGGHIRVMGFADDDSLVITIEDNGVGIKEDTMYKLNLLPFMDAGKIEALYPNNSGGYGIANVISRLCIAYGDKFSIKYKNSDIGTQCKIVISKSVINKRDNS